MVLDGNSEMGAHVWSDLGYLICYRHVCRARAGSLLQERLIFLHTCATGSVLPSNTRIMRTILGALHA